MQKDGVYLRNVFTDHQIKLIKDLIDEQYKTKEEVSLTIEEILSGKEMSKLRIENHSGRIRVEFAPNDMSLPLPKEVIDAVEAHAKEINPDYYLESCYYVHYQMKYGRPNLDPHLDNHPAQYTIDYQLETNCQWDVVVEGTAYPLNDNDALIINTNGQVHWREPRKFEEHEFVKMIFFHFSDGTQEVLPRQERQGRSEYWQRVFWDKTNKIFGAQ